MIKNVELDLEFKNYIPKAPFDQEQLYKNASNNDSVTINSWRKQWLEQMAKNHLTHGPFKDRGIGKLFGENALRPCIVAGAGPSLKNNIEELKDPVGIPIISCLHNFHYMVDNEVPVKYFINLDAGEVTIEEISEGGSKTHEEYIEATKNYTLLAYTASHPNLLKLWKGDILFFMCPLGDEEYKKKSAEIEPFHTYVSTGGNVLGACTYIAKGILGSNPIIFVGADFSFSYTKQFHPWKSKYDGNIGHAMRCVDIWGHGVLTWQSYYNFKCWFDWLSNQVRGIYINATEGGLLGSYPEGNIDSIRQMTLKDVKWMYSMYKTIEDQCKNSGVDDNKILF